MSTIIERTRKLRRALGDDPTRSNCTGGSPVPLQTAATAINVPNGHIGRFRAGMRFEFDDNTGEVLEVDSTDTDTSIVTALRGRDGTDPAQHTNGTTILIEPDISYPFAADIINSIVSDELWPDVWIFGESTLTYHSGSDYYSPSVTDIERVVYAYQLVSGYRYSLDFNWLSPQLVADANGAITIPNVADYSTIYYAYRVRPTLANLTSELERLVDLGTTAEAMSLREGRHTSPDRSSVDATVGDGAALRAGLVRWQRFVDARTRENTRLIQLEQEKAPAAGALLR